MVLGFVEAPGVVGNEDCFRGETILQLQSMTAPHPNDLVKNILILRFVWQCGMCCLPKLDNERFHMFQPCGDQNMAQNILEIIENVNLQRAFEMFYRSTSQHTTAISTGFLEPCTRSIGIYTPSET